MCVNYNKLNPCQNLLVIILTAKLKDSQIEKSCMLTVETREAADVMYGIQLFIFLCHS